MRFWKRLSFNQLQQQYPTWSEPYFYRGLIKNELKEYDQAIKEWKDALKQMQNSSRKILIFEYLIELEKNRKEFNQAIPWYQELLKYQPYDAESYYKLAKCYLEKKDCPRAIQQYLLVLYLKPEFFKVYFDRGEAYFLLNRKEEAKADFKIFLGESKQKEGKEILECCEKIFKRFPELNVK